MRDAPHLPATQLPSGDDIFLDHVGHFVADPAAATDALTRAGFAPTDPSIQSNPDGSLTGTGNVTAMLRRGYLEFLFKTADTPLGREFDASRSRHAGLHLMAFAVADAVKAHRGLQQSGFSVRPLVEMQRPVEMADGPAIAAFTVARVEAGAMPEGRVQLLTHRTERAVWQPRWLDHPNGAQGLLDILVVVADVAEAAERFARFTGRAAAANASGRRVGLDRGGIQLVAESAARDLISGLPLPALPFMMAYGVAVVSLDATEAFLRGKQIPVSRQPHALIVRFPDALGIGAWVFVENDARLPWLERPIA